MVATQYCLRGVEVDRWLQNLWAIWGEIARFGLVCGVGKNAMWFRVLSPFVSGCVLCLVLQVVSGFIIAQFVPEQCAVNL